MKAPRNSRLKRARSEVGLAEISEHPILDVTKSADDTWQQFVEFINSKPHSNWIFRGAGSINHTCVPSIGRIKYYDREAELNIFRAFKRSARQFASSLPSNDWEWLALAQHHGLPTRLLDWTSNPLIACYFAVVSPPFDSDAVIYAHSLSVDDLIDPDTAIDPFDIKRVHFYIPAKIAPRIVSQRGLFSVHDKPDTIWTPPELNKNQFVIPELVRPALRRQLFRLGVDASNVMTDLDGLCQSLAWRYRERIGVSGTMIG